VRYLLDTDIIIYWMKGNRSISNKIVSEGFSNIASADISKAELYYGAYKSQRTEANLAAIKNLSERINFVPFNEPAQSVFGMLKADLEKKGTRLDDVNLMIASTAIAFNLVLITNNTGHMQRIPGIQIENWA
jgi:tRNA(fMet)-specific endonuclease VapC